MKKLFVIFLCCLFFAATAMADITFHNANQFKMTWTEVSEDIDGDPVENVSYRLYLANANTDPDKTNPAMIWEGPELETVFSLGQKGRYFVGIQAVSGEQESVINWADEPEHQEGIALFGLRFAVPPKAPRGLERK